MLFRTRTGSDQKCGSDVSLRSVNQKCGSEVSLKSLTQKCQSVLLRSVAQKCRTELRKFRSDACSRVLRRGIAHSSEGSFKSVAQERWSCRWPVCRNVARIVPQAAVLLTLCGSDVSLESVFGVSLRSAAPVLPRSIIQRCRSEVSLKSVASVTQKRRLHVCVCVCSEVLLRS